MGPKRKRPSSPTSSNKRSLSMKAKAASVSARLAAKKAAAAAKKREKSKDEAEEEETKGNQFRAAPSSSSSSKKAQVYDVDFAELPVSSKRAGLNPYLSHLRVPSEPSEPFDDASSNDIPRPKYRDPNAQFNWLQPGTIVTREAKLNDKIREVNEAGYGTGRKGVSRIGGVEIVREVNSSDDAIVAASHSVSSSLHFGSGSSRLAPRSDACLLPPISFDWWDVELCSEQARKLIRRDEKVREKEINRWRIRGSSKKVKKNDVPATRYQSNDVDADRPPSSSMPLSAQTAAFSSMSHKNVQSMKYVCHPIPVGPPYDAAPGPKASAAHLTKKERARLRRLKRQETVQDLRDAQALGLIAPPEPRLTAANFMKVMGDQAVLDPSKVERAVRAQVQSRIDAHNESNKSRMLTPAQRKSKKLAKLNEAISDSRTLTVASFAVKDVSHKLHRAKMDLTASQNLLTGVVCSGPPGRDAVVVVEGDEKSVRRFEGLMERRINWSGGSNLSDSDSDSDDESDDGDGTGLGDGKHLAKSKVNRSNSCAKTFKGQTIKRNFQGFTFHQCDNERDRDNVLRDFKHLS